MNTNFCDSQVFPISEKCVYVPGDKVCVYVPGDNSQLFPISEKCIYVAWWINLKPKLDNC